MLKSIPIEKKKRNCYIFFFYHKYCAWIFNGIWRFFFQRQKKSTKQMTFRWLKMENIFAVYVGVQMNEEESKKNVIFSIYPKLAANGRIMDSCVPCRNHNGRTICSLFFSFSLFVDLNEFLCLFWVRLGVHAQKRNNSISCWNLCAFNLGWHWATRKWFTVFSVFVEWFRVFNMVSRLIEVISDVNYQDFRCDFVCVCDKRQ